MRLGVLFTWLVLNSLQMLLSIRLNVYSVRDLLDPISPRIFLKNLSLCT